MSEPVSIRRHHVLQRLIVRLLHDPTQLRRLYAEPEWACERFKISEEEYRWLTQIDARRWEVDPERPHRSLEGALAHCPVTALVFSSWCEHARRAGEHWESGVEELIAFYQSEAFHQCIERQERLAESLMAWLLSALERRSAPASLMSAHSFTSAMIELELSVTRLRNELETLDESELEVSTNLPHLSPLARLSLPSSYRLIDTRDGLVDVYLALFAEAERRSASSRVELLRGSLKLSELANMVGESASVALLERHAHGVSVEELSSGLAGVLKLAARGERLESLLELLIEGGFEPAEAKDQAADWIREGLITLTSS